MTYYAKRRGRRIFNACALLLFAIFPAAVGAQPTPGARLVVQEGHFDAFPPEVTSVAFSPDGKYVVTGSRDSSAILWESGTGRELRRFERPGGGITSVAFSHDGLYVLTGSPYSSAQLWDIGTGKERQRFVVPEFEAEEVAISSDGRFVLTRGWGGKVRLWSSATGKQIRSFKGHTDDLSWVSFSPDGHRILSSGSDLAAALGNINVWDVRDGRKALSERRFRNGVTSAAFSPDGTKILVGSGKQAIAYDFANRTKPVVFKGPARQVVEGMTRQVTSVAFCRDGQLVVTGDAYDGTTRLWDAASGQLIRDFFLPGYSPGETYSVAFSPDGTQVLTSHGARAILWDRKTGDQTVEFKGYSSFMSSAIFSPCGDSILTGSGDGAANLWDLDTFRYRKRLSVGMQTWEQLFSAPTATSDTCCLRFQQD